MELLGRVARDDDALQKFYRRYAGLVYSLALRMLGDRARAEEILQETILRVWCAAITHDPARGKPEAWVVTIARNFVLTALRHGRPISLEEDQDAAERIADKRDGTERAACVSARRELVQQAVADLPANQRRVVRLAYFEGLSTPRSPNEPASRWAP